MHLRNLVFVFRGQGLRAAQRQARNPAWGHWREGLQGLPDGVEEGGEGGRGLREAGPLLQGSRERFPGSRLGPWFRFCSQGY